MPPKPIPTGIYELKLQEIVKHKHSIADHIQRLKASRRVNAVSYTFAVQDNGENSRFCLDNSAIEAYLKYIKGDNGALDSLALDKQIALACIFDKTDLLKKLIESNQEHCEVQQTLYISIADLHTSKESATLLALNIKPKELTKLVHYLIDRDYHFIKEKFLPPKERHGHIYARRTINYLRWLEHDCHDGKEAPPPRNTINPQLYSEMKANCIVTKTVLNQQNDPISQLNYLRYFYEKYIENNQNSYTSHRLYFYATFKPLLISSNAINNTMKLDDEKDLQVLVYHYLYFLYPLLPAEQGGCKLSDDNARAFMRWIKMHEDRSIQNALSVVLPQLHQLNRFFCKAGFADLTPLMTKIGNHSRYFNLDVYNHITQLDIVIFQLTDYSKSRLMLNCLYTAYFQLYEELKNRSYHKDKIISDKGLELLASISSKMGSFKNHMLDSPTDQTHHETLLNTYQKKVIERLKNTIYIIDESKLNAYIRRTFDSKKPLMNHFEQIAFVNLLNDLIRDGAIEPPKPHHPRSLGRARQASATQQFNQADPRQGVVATKLRLKQLSKILGHPAKIGDLQGISKLLSTSIFTCVLEQYTPIGLFNGDMSLATKQFIFDNLQISLKSTRQNGIYQYHHRGSETLERYRHSTQLTMSAYLLLLGCDLLFHKFQVDNEENTGLWITQLKNTVPLGHVNVAITTQVKSLSDFRDLALAIPEIEKLTLRPNKQLALPLNQSLKHHAADFSLSFNKFLLLLQGLKPSASPHPVTTGQLGFYSISKNANATYQLSLDESQNLPHLPGIYLNLALQLFIFLCFKEQTFNYPKPFTEDKSHISPEEINAINAYDSTLRSFIDCYAALTSLTSVEEFMDESAQDLLDDKWQAFYTLVIAGNLRFTSTQMPILEQAIDYANAYIAASLNKDDMMVDEPDERPDNVQDAFSKSYNNGDLIPIRMLGQKTRPLLNNQITLEIGKYQDPSMFYPCTLIKNGIPINSYASHVYPQNCQLGLIFQPIANTSTQYRDEYTTWFAQNGYTSALDKWCSPDKTPDEIRNHLQKNNALTAFTDPRIISAKISHSYSKFKGTFPNKPLREVFDAFIQHCQFQHINAINIDIFNQFLTSKQWETTEYSSLCFHEIFNRASPKNNTVTRECFTAALAQKRAELLQKKDPSRKAHYSNAQSFLSHNELLIRGLDPLREPQPDEANSLLSRMCGDVVGIIFCLDGELVRDCLPQLLDYLLSKGRRIDSLVFAHKDPVSHNLVQYDLPLLLSTYSILFKYYLELYGDESSNKKNQDNFCKLPSSTEPMKLFTNHAAIKKSIQDILSMTINPQRRLKLEPNSQGKDSLFSAIVRLYNSDKQAEQHINVDQVISACVKQFPDKYRDYKPELNNLPQPDVEKELVLLVTGLDMVVTLTKINTQGDTVTAEHFKISPAQRPGAINTNNLKMLNDMNPNAKKLIMVDETLFTTLTNTLVPNFGLAGKKVEPEPKGHIGKRHMSDNTNAKRHCS